ncbi:hypothetical protein FPZ12_001545 [Amycolatopsis acidicola]|uniref:Uncharacterized protein n=1 Tax=Amycolatopsis acidicola TaxID=2596893 RepID=A0A5N0VQL1_9PSEU|nr:hypothetical protein [Amycolatopsis acidicola]KAA9166901.1 hypothetical protein FPZ12_001545 [Amycolatopsis acidicola]
MRRRDESRSALVRRALLVACGMAICGLVMLAAVLLAATVLDRGSPLTAAFVAVATIFGSAAAGLALRAAVTRLLSAA